MDGRMNAMLCTRCWSTNVKGAIAVHKERGTPREAVIHNSNYVDGGG